MEFQFYHLLTTPLEVALPKLAATAYARDIRCCIVADDANLDTLDKAIWTYDPNSFVPHARHDPSCEDDAQQPVLLHTQPVATNHASLVMITNGITFSHAEQKSVTRVFDIFNGNDQDATAHARSRWSAYKDEGIPLSYIKQQEQGGWEKIMSVNQPQPSDASS